MSEFSREQDEVASAYLDDVATAEERALVDADPALLVRVEELRSVHDALADPVAPPTTAERDAAITAALGASRVVDLDAARARRLRVLSIAAAIVVVLGAAGLLIRAADNNGGARSTAAAASVASAGDGRTGAGAAATGAGGGIVAPSSSTSGRPALGSFADRSALAAAVQTRAHLFASGQSKQAESAPMTGDSATTTPTCLVPTPAGAGNELYAATAVLEGRPVQVDVFAMADGSFSLVVTDPADCTQVFTQPL